MLLNQLHCKSYDPSSPNTCLKKKHIEASTLDPAADATRRMRWRDGKRESVVERWEKSPRVSGNRKNWGSSSGEQLADIRSMRKKTRSHDDVRAPAAAKGQVRVCDSTTAGSKLMSVAHIATEDCSWMSWSGPLPKIMYDIQGPY